MVRIGSIDDPAALREEGRLRDGSLISGIHLISSPKDTNDNPHAFLVRQSPASQLPAHFHLNREFQIVTEGSGRLGRHKVQPFTVHYATGHTGYGPVIAGSEGLGYLTLRQVVERGALFLPQNRHLMQPDYPRRQKTAEIDIRVDLNSLRIETPECSAMLEQDETGLGVWLTRIPPNGAAAPPPGEGGADRYHVVIRGAVKCLDVMRRSLSVIWYPANEPARLLEAGASGAEILIAQFPRPGIEG